MGLENIYGLTDNSEFAMELRIVLEDWDGATKDAYYDSFRLENAVCLKCLNYYYRYQKLHIFCLVSFSNFI